ncbi:YcaO-like family protein [Nocardia camponoti]|uniref:YcaO-like family protein n=1 Tax=Nocardia camponoti TaxID=1616106 RepID=UPI0016643A4D|nr:YcaO-like family protein [Nocardia camponoti]
MPELAEIPVRYFARRCQADPNLWGVKAGIRVTHSGQSRPVVGFSCGEEPEAAWQRARSELFERLLTAWLKMSWAEASFRESVAPSTAAAIESLIGRDATGLAFHPDSSQARAHATFELMERHILGRIWYDDLRIQPLESSPRWSAPNVETALYTTVRQVELGHFVLSSIYDKRNEIFVVGSAIRETMNEAAEHAWEEAAVMHDSQLNDSQSPYVRPQSRERHRSLRGALSKDRFRHLQSKVGSTGEGGMRAIAVPSRLAREQLVQTSVGCLVRSWVPTGDFALVSDYRAANTDIVRDPFC